ncbi:MAG TPA: twin-arginine translocation signal domain-containing protein, partial [Chitinophagaceae bacterium]|nr:twin-arginine translocation signal domain-containing protein [Chitinophagaceae bacterium]
MERRTFVKYSAAAGAAMMLPTLESMARSGSKIKVVQVGTGHRGTGFWGKDLIKSFGDILDYLGVY